MIQRSYIAIVLALATFVASASGQLKDNAKSWGDIGAGQLWFVVGYVEGLRHAQDSSTTMFGDLQSRLSSEPEVARRIGAIVRECEERATVKHAPPKLS